MSLPEKKHFKDFSQIVNDPKYQVDYVKPKKKHKDPNDIPSLPVIKQIREMHTRMFVGQFLGSLAASIFTGPLTTSHTLLQLSVAPHRKMYTPEATQHEALVKVSKEITPQQRRKYELLLRSGATEAQQPFRAAVYTGYRDVFQGLSKQGFLGFYKGNFIGLLHNGLRNHTKMAVLMPINYMAELNYEGALPMKIAVNMVVMTLSDIMFQPLRTVQSRFILQNRLKNFMVYPTAVDAFVRKHGLTENFKGWQVNIPLNLLRGINIAVNFTSSNQIYPILAQYTIGNLLCYPLMTVQRRLECQTSLPGMIPIRYRGLFHGLRLIMSEEGIKGLYRGFIGFSLVEAFGLALMLNSLSGMLIEK